MGAKTLTTANSVIMLTVNGLYNSPQQLQGYAADDLFDTDEVDRAETVMGIDGILSGGFIYVKQPWSITLQANSPSAQLFDTWDQSEIAQQDIYYADMTIALPGLGTKYAFSNGIFMRIARTPSAKKIVQPRKFTIEWESISPAPN